MYGLVDGMAMTDYGFCHECNAKTPHTYTDSDAICDICFPTYSDQFPYNIAKFIAWGLLIIGGFSTLSFLTAIPSLFTGEPAFAGLIIIGGIAAVFLFLGFKALNATPDLMPCRPCQLNTAPHKGNVHVCSRCESPYV